MAKRRINYTNCSILLLVIAFIAMLFGGCGMPKGFIHIGQNLYLNANNIKVVENGVFQGGQSDGQKFWMATVEGVEINPKDDTVLDRTVIWVSNYNPYTNTIDGSYYYTEDITNVFGWDNTTKGYALYDAFDELYNDYLKKQLK